MRNEDDFKLFFLIGKNYSHLAAGKEEPYIPRKK